ncbi:tyrosine recombinase XerC [Acetobacter sp. DsW_063]|uniref:site-specific integrase n=1 Tax=Acetobacter sp. DsW_063 TaxID=1514894 RepID=UPI001E364A68|nr:site-specific integrase [Acetobacter sp. DsW_063]
MGCEPELSVKLKYIQKLKDRHGKQRFYFRRKGQRPVTLPHPDAPEFLEAYYKALNGVSPKAAPAQYHETERSLRDVIGSYYASAEYRALKVSTKEVYFRLLERVRTEEYSKSPLARMEQKHVRMVVARYSESPTTANRILRLLGQLCQFSIQRGWIDTDPTVGVKRARIKTEGHTPWSDEDIAQYEGAYPIGTKQRLALALFLYTGQRKSDVVPMREKDVHGDLIAVVQQKTSARLMIPIHPELRRCLDVWEPTISGYFLTPGSNGDRPFSVKGFSATMGDWRRAAGLPDGLSPHGLRKAAARRLAEAGCTPHQIAAITGHRTLAEVERYTRDVKQVQLAREAISLLKPSVKPSKVNTSDS